MKTALLFLSLTLGSVNLWANDMNTRSFTGGTGEENKACCETSSGGGNGFVILAYQEGVQIMDLAPQGVNENTSFLAEVASEDENLASMEVTTPEGQMVWKNDTRIAKGYNALRFNLQNLRRGVYFLKIKTTQGSAVKTFYVK